MRPTDSTLVRVLRERALEQPEREAFVFLADGEVESDRLTYGELDFKARAIGAALGRSSAEGERVLLLYPPGLEFIRAFFGCLYAGCVAVPAYPPRRRRQGSRLSAIVEDAAPAAVLTTRSTLARAEALSAAVPALRGVEWIATRDVDDAVQWQEPRLVGETLAMLQYTSGSTSFPKGVVVTHGQLIHNEAMIRSAFGQSDESVVVSWLPLYHDMGLIGGVLQPLYVGARSILMSPMAFLQRPDRWLRAITRYRATTSGGPNFAYDLCARRIRSAARAELDLESWQVAFNGSEPVRGDTLERFAAVFGPCGFRRRAFYPCYGLAEATLFVSGGSKEERPVTRAVQPAALEQGRAAPLEGAAAPSRLLVGCGRPWGGQEVLVVDPQSALPCRPGEVGEIWVAGPSVARGYWNRLGETERTFGAHVADSGEGPFLRTGDLGFFADGELYVTGRLKDLIIIRGRNLYPQDVELTAERSHPGLRPGGGAAFAVESEGRECLVVVHEVKRRHRSAAETVVEALRRAVAEEYQVRVSHVVLVKTGTVPKTTSGKIRRRECRRRFLDGELAIVARSAPEVADTDGLDVEIGLDRQELLALPATQRRPRLESHLRTQVAHLLGVRPSRIAVDESLSASGLDSLTGAELKVRLEEELQTSCSLARILEGLSVRELAEEVLATLDSSLPVPGILQDEAEEPRTEPSLSYGQKALWFLHQLDRESAAYHIAAAGRVRSSLDPGRLRRAFQGLVDRHPALRTAFRAPTGEPVSHVAPESRLDDLEEDVSTLNEAGLRARLGEVAWQPFDLERGPLLRVKLLSRSPRERWLVVAIHHIISDFWSLGILARELGRLYRQEVDGTPAALAPLELRFADHARREARRLAGPEGERLWEYWRGQLGGELPVLDLATDRPRPPVQSYRGASQALTVTREVTAEVRALGRTHGATLFMTLLGVFQVLLHRYTRQDDLLVGTPTSGRASAELSGLVGYFVNPVALRADLTGGPSFAELLGRTRRAALEAFEHQGYPFALLAERLLDERDPSRSPIFQTLFALQRAPSGEPDALAAFALGEDGASLHLDGLVLESVELPQRSAQFDLELRTAETAGGLKASLIFNTDLYDASTAARMLKHFATLLGSLAAHSEERLCRLPLLCAAERQQLSCEWQGRDLPLPERSFHELFEARAGKTPEAVAAVMEEKHLSYRRLNGAANLLARALHDRRIGPEDLVAVLAERGLKLMSAMLGIWKAGAVYLPLDPRHPAARLRQVCLCSGAVLALCERGLEPELRRALADRPSPEVLRLDRLRHRGTDERSPPACCRPENLAYVIYTSGSTGVPKGVMVKQQGMLNHLRSKVRDFGIGREDHVAQSASQCFDISIWQFLAALLAGGRVDVLRDEAAFDPGRLLGEAVRRGVSILQVVPSTLPSSLGTGGPTDAGSLRWMISTGEALPAETCRQWLEACPEVPLANSYGPTECSDAVTCSPSLQLPAPGAASVSMGHPVIRTRVSVLDRDLGEVPVGVPGELFLGGTGVGRGYLGDPGRSAEAFCPRLRSQTAGARWYRTGDLVRRRNDGSLEFLGRLDHQVKVRGHRIELGEIETALAEHPGIRQAVVLAPEQGGQKRLVGYALRKDSEPDPNLGELRELLGKKLPDYMLPSAVIFLDAFPLSPNGKLDRKALPAPTWSRSELAVELVLPRTQTEELVAGFLAQLLEVEKVGIYDNFFELGGHSLLATRVMSRIRAVFEVGLAVRELFEEPTAAGLARRVEAARQGDRRATATLEPFPRQGDLPLSFAQERLWFLEQSEPAGPVYVVPATVRLRGKLAAGVLCKSLAEVVRRHEALRTTFPVRGGHAVQAIAEPAPVSLPVVDLSSLAAVDRESVAWRLARKEGRRGFDLARGPLYRFALLKLVSEDHIALLTWHHIVSDGWSMTVVAEELEQLYKAFLDGRPSPLPELDWQYADHTLWQRQLVERGRLEGALAYWREQLAGKLPALGLETDRPRPAALAPAGARHSRALAGSVCERIRGLGRQESVTPFMVFLTVFDMLLCRYTGETDVLVGSPIANRNRAETEKLVGLFVNTLVLRADLSGDPTFRACLARLRKSCLEAYVHQDLPFGHVVEELRSRASIPRQDLSRNPIFQVMFDLQDVPREIELEGLRTELRTLDYGVSKLDLTLFVERQAERFTVSIEYRTDLWDPSTIDRMSRHFTCLVESSIAEPRKHARELAFLTPPERHELLVEWNDTGRDGGLRQGVLELYESQAKRSPERVAVVAEDECLSYGELNRRANRLAHRLCRQGVAPEVRVGLYTERCLEMLVGLLGIVKAGGAYVPLQADLPANRRDLVLEDAGVHAVVTRDRFLAELGKHRTVTIRTDTEDGAPDEDPERRGVLENLAYVIYTSGSTGRPKGVTVPHAALVNHCRHVSRAYGLHRGDRVLQFASLTFDVAAEELFPSWAGGATVVLRSGELYSSFADFEDFLRRRRLTVLNLPATYWHDWTSDLRRSGRALPPTLRLVVAGNEAVSAEKLAAWRRHAGEAVTFLNAYGPTEATIGATIHKDVGSRESPGVRSVPIGRPNANVRTYLLDRQLHPMPTAVLGEIAIGGRGVTRGYLNRPARTAERFIPDPFSHAGGAVLYKTGDLARYHVDGGIEFVRRADHQVKVRGFRIELGEVETALEKHPGVRRAVAQTHRLHRLFEDGPQEENGDKRLVAYLECHGPLGEDREGEHGQDAPAAGELRDFLRRQLPEFMLPATFVVLDELPLTPGGKVDRGALEPPAASPRTAAQSIDAPVSPVEELLAEIWKDLLGLNDVASGDSFFELGGHSLLATRLVSRLREALGVEVTLRDLFERPTLAAMAATVEALDRAGGRQAAPALESVPRDAPLALSFAQERLRFLDRLEPGNPAYNMAAAVRLSGRLDVTSFVRALGEIVRRHEVLRTRFPLADDGEPVQVISPSSPPDMPRIDLGRLAEVTRESELRRLATAAARQSFNLSRGPLLRLRLLGLAKSEHALLVSMHHVISDGWSLGVLLDELAALYPAFKRKAASPLVKLPIQYADFAAWQRRLFQGEWFERQLAWWKTRLAGAPPALHLPVDRPRPAVRSGHGSTKLFAWPDSFGRRLDLSSQAMGVTLFMTLTGAFAALLSRYTDQQDILLGSPVANRNRSETEGLIGFFVNTLVLRSDLSGDPTFHELAARVRDGAVAAFDRQDLPFEKLVEELQPERNLSQNPLFQVMFALQNTPMPVFDLEEVSLHLLPVDTGRARFDLTLELAEEVEGLEGRLEYNTDIFDPTTMARMLRHYATLLEGVLANPRQRLSELPLLSRPEQWQLRVEWNRTERSYPRDPCLHELFEAQARRTPEATAVVLGEDRLTYTQLDRRANQLARFLRDMGVSQEVRVGVAMQRSTEMVVALLAVLKAGGAYVPLDVEYPRERLRYLFDDSRAELLVTRSELLRGIPVEGKAIVAMDSDREEIARRSEEGLAPGATPENLAYLIYTSGSTGKPKGVAIEHHSPVAMIRWAAETFSPDDLRGVLASTSICFDLSVFELFVPLSLGGAVVLVDNALQLSERAGIRPVTLVNSVPSVTAELLEIGELPDSVRVVNLAGEALQPALVRNLSRSPGLGKIFNLYGPSEDTTYSTFAEIAKGTSEKPLIGRPVANTRAYVLDVRLRPTAIGVPGELCLAGQGLARGYLNRPVETARSFLPDPFTGRGGRRLYRTGDLARFRSDGALDFLGRRDHQVKIRGFRIELGELEAALCEHPAVSDAVAVAERGAPGGESDRLVAYAVARVDPPPATVLLRDFLSVRLPAPMVPSLIVVMDELPLTTNGKVDRERLPKPHEEDLGAEAKLAPPRNPTEEILASMWKELLGLRQVGIHDSFFELGGHSLMAGRVISRIREALGVEIPVRVIFEKTTIAALGAEVDRMRRDGKPETEPMQRSVPKPTGSLAELMAELHGPPGRNS